MSKDLLIKRGLLVPDVPKALRILSSVNYYRLRPYWIPFQDRSAAQIDTEPPFYNGTTFDDILRHYRFDRKLRNLITDALERLEVSIKTQLAYHLAHDHGIKALEDSSLFTNAGDHATGLQLLVKAWRDSKEDFAIHYRTKYATDFSVVPPTWVSVELMTFTQASKWYRNLAIGPAKRNIAKFYGIHVGILEQTLEHLSVVRNTCAHHSRLWNRHTASPFACPNRLDHEKKPGDICNLFNRQPRHAGCTFNVLLMLHYLMEVISPNHSWTNRLHCLLDRFGKVSRHLMGFNPGQEDIFLEILTR